ncbi:hypothetical protein [Archangium sp.]|uniref:hypothetical protein n=1 Tax=Archangium sp. TaxID=1872627 RepID=UPI002D303993|nr:hypothetical protein [Archangium sp.]HYO57092.1 hypothetical protein [Archangium sp.]
MSLRHVVLRNLLVLGVVACGPTVTGAGAEEQELAHLDQVRMGVCTVTPIPAPNPCNLPGIGTVQYVCDVITQNTACDAAANAYYGAADQLVNSQCNRDNNAAWRASLEAAISYWTGVRNNAANFQEAMCAQQHIDQYTQQAMQASQAVGQLDMQIACLHNTLAERQCDFAKCLATPACKPVLARGPGGAGAGCTDGSECQSGLCLAGTNTCANPPIDYCCLAPTDNRCPTFQQNLYACRARIQQETNGYPYP